MLRKPRVLFMLMCYLIIVSTSSLAHKPARESLTLGVFPYLPARELEQMYAPAASRFSKILGVRVNLRTRPDFERFREQVRQQSYDIIFIQPFDYIRAAADNGYLPLARRALTRDSTGELRAIFVVRTDSSFSTLNDLEGQRIATPDRDAAVSLLGRHVLSRLQLDDKIETHSVSNHMACLRQVQVKKSAACVTSRHILEIFQKRTSMQLRVLYETSPIPAPLYAVHRRVPEEQRERLKKAILSWNADSRNGMTDLRLEGWSRLYPASDRDYDPVRVIWETLNSRNQ